MELETRFIDHSGVAPQEFVANARFEMACALIEDVGVPLPVIAMRSGLGGIDRMNEEFARRLGVGVAAYRRRFVLRRQDSRSKP